MRSYYFTKYNSKTNTAHFAKYLSTDTVICFDLEDSIEQSADKIIFRNYLKKIFEETIPSLPGIKTGVRVNNSVEIENDLKALSGLALDTLIIPKVESSKQLYEIEKKLIDFRIEVNQLLPLIETRKGLISLKDMVVDLPDKVKNIGFGHCDYNESLNIFPFFHQDSYEYWKWVDEFKKVLDNTDIGFVNSSFLNIEDDKMFNKSLQLLSILFYNKCSQFTLTGHQTDMVNRFVRPSETFLQDFLIQKLDLTPSKEFTEKFISGFESSINGRSFAIIKTGGIKKLISPHEYRSAKIFLLTNHFKIAKLTFVGGCFPVQHDIVFEELFHQQLKRKTEAACESFRLDINIIRYERLASVMDKIQKYNRIKPVNILVFHIRPEPFLRLSKFYYKYMDFNGEIRHSLNIPALKVLNPEKYDLLITGRKILFLSRKSRGKIKKWLITLNYMAGRLFRNDKYARQIYLKTTMQVINYCKTNKIVPVVLGPVERHDSSPEPGLCKELNRFMADAIKTTGTEYIDCLSSDEYNQKLFFNDNGIHTTTAFHHFISEKLYEKINHNVTSNIS